MTTTAKRNLVLLGLDSLTFIIGFSGFLFILCSAGAQDTFAISGSSFIVRGLIGICMMGLSVVVYKIRVSISKYFRRISKKNK